MEKALYDPVQLTESTISHRLKTYMEAQDEVVKDSSEKSTAPKTSAGEPEAVVKAREAWQKANERRERVGRTVTRDEREEQEKFIKAGIKPPEYALPPEKIEELLLAPNSGVQVEALILELQAYEKTGAVTPAYFGGLEKAVNALVAGHKIPADEGEKLVIAAQKMAIAQMGPGEGGAGPRNPRQRRERPPRASDSAEEDAARVQANAMDSISEQDRWFSESPARLRMAEELAEQKASISTNLPEFFSPEDRKGVYMDAARRDIYRQFHKPETQISNRDNIAAKYEPHFLNAQKAILGEVDSQGRLTGKGKTSIEALKRDLETGEIHEFLSVMAQVEERNWDNEIKEIKEEPNEGLFREKLEKLINVAEDVRATRLMHERNFNPPNSIQEIAQDVVATDIADFRTGGKYAMFKRVRGEDGNEHMKFQQSHFIQWARSKMLKWEEDNPDDPQDMFKLVGIFGTTRGVSLSEMILTPGFFRDRDTGDFLDDLKMDLIYEAWPWKYVRDSNITYRQTKGSDEDLGPKALGPIYEQNVLTKPDVLNKMVNMSDIMTEFDPNEKNSHTGQALRMALMTYHDITNQTILEQMMNINGGDLAFFDNKKFLDKYVGGQMYKENKGEYLGSAKTFGDKYSAILFRKRNNEALTAEDNRFLDETRGYDKNDPRAVVKKYVDAFFNLSKPTAALFDSEGKLKKDKAGNPRIKDYINAINIFFSAQPSDPLIKEIRERVRLSVMEKMEIDYDSARWVEAWAYKLTPFTGINSRNDTASIGFDSYSKTLNTGYYSQHQSIARRAGAYGNKYTMFQFKRLGMDFYSITTDAGPSILEYIQGGQGNEVDFEKRANVMVFGENTMSHFYSDHVLRTFNEFHELIESKNLKLHEIVNTDPYGRVHYDSQKFNELVRDTFLKNMRYPYSTWANLDFTEEMMMFEEDVDPKTGLAVPGSTHYVSRPIARHMFGKAMFNGRYSVMLEYEDLDLNERLKAKRYYQVEKRLNSLARNVDVARARIPNYDKLSNDEKARAQARELRAMSLEEKLGNDTQEALTAEEKDFLGKERDWFYSKDMTRTRDIVTRMDTAFAVGGEGRQHFWKEAAKVRIAAELKEARKRFGNVQTMMSFEEVEKFLSAIDQLDANIFGEEGNFGGAKPMGRVFTKQDIAWIRKMSGTGFLRMAAGDIGEGLAAGSVEGIWKAFAFLMGQIAK